MVDVVTGITAGTSLLGGIMGDDGGSEGVSNVANFNFDAAQKFLDLYMNVEAPFRDAAVGAQTRLIPQREALESFGLTQASKDLSRYGMQTPGLEAKLLQGIEEGTTDRSDRRAAESIAATEAAYDQARENVGIYASRRGGTPGDTMTRNQMLQTEIAKAGASSSEANKAVDREQQRLDAYKINAPVTGLNHFKQFAPNPSTNVLAGSTPTTPGSITGASSAASSGYGQAARNETEGWRSIGDFVGGVPWDKLSLPTPSSKPAPISMAGGMGSRNGIWT